jgi:hypothetical protein
MAEPPALAAVAGSGSNGVLSQQQQSDRYSLAEMNNTTGQHGFYGGMRGQVCRPMYA